MKYYRCIFGTHNRIKGMRRSWEPAKRRFIFLTGGLFTLFECAILIPLALQGGLHPLRDFIDLAMIIGAAAGIGFLSARLVWMWLKYWLDEVDL
jgi:hypothetical protein